MRTDILRWCGVNVKPETTSGGNWEMNWVSVMWDGEVCKVAVIAMLFVEMVDVCGVRIVTMLFLEGLCGGW